MAHQVAPSKLVPERDWGAFSSPFRRQHPSSNYQLPFDSEPRNRNGSLTLLVQRRSSGGESLNDLVPRGTTQVPTGLGATLVLLVLSTI